MINKKKVFISYISADKRKMDLLKNAINNITTLEAVVVDNKMNPGKLLSQKVIDNITKADYFVPILTHESITSQWVNQEIGYAKSKLSDNNILPIIGISLLNNLKGFIHKEIDLSFNYDDTIIYEASKSKNFKKTCIQLIKYIQEKELPEYIDMVSDETTIFKESIKYPELSKNTPTVIVPNAHNLIVEAIDKFKNFFPESHWICHTHLIKSEEAIYGGDYVFKKDFEFCYSTEIVKSAILYCLVDDFVKFKFNGRILKNKKGRAKSMGYKEVHEYNLKPCLKSDNNTLLIMLENISFEDQYKNSTAFRNDKEKGKTNPYGIIYSIRIQLK